MTTEKFESLVSKRLDFCVETLLNKSLEYATDTDRLANLRRASTSLNEPMAYVCWVYLTKHLTSISMLADGTLQATPNLIDEKITDAINYLLLLEACLVHQPTNKL